MLVEPLQRVPDGQRAMPARQCPALLMEHLECEMQPLSRDARLHCPIAISHEWYGIAGPQRAKDVAYFWQVVMT